MKKLLLLVAFLFSSPAIADPTIFDMEPGKTTESELSNMYNATPTGINKYSDGSMYAIPTSAINFEGLRNVTAIFDTDNTLVAVLTEFHKNKFNYLYETLNKKYQRISQTIPHVGNKKAEYRDGGTIITLDAPHMSFQMSMSYARAGFIDKFKQKNAAEKRQKQQSEASKL